MELNEDELEGLTRFVYQCPVGLIELDESGTVHRINPAAARMLAPALRDHEDLTELFPVLDRLCPTLVPAITRDPDEMGPLGTGTRIVVEPGGHHAGKVEIRAVRVDRNQIMLACTDVTEEQRLARRNLELARRLRDVVSAIGVYRQAAANALQIGVSGVLALEELLTRGPRTPGSLAHRVGLTTSSVTSTVDHLQQAGLVARVPNPRDRRSVLVVLTPAGEQRVRPLLNLLTGGIDTTVGPAAVLHDDDAAAVLDSVTSALRAHAGGARRPRADEPVASTPDAPVHGDRSDAALRVGAGDVDSGARDDVRAG